MVVHDPCVGGDQRLGADVVAGDVLQPRLAQGGDRLVDERRVANVARLGGRTAQMLVCRSQRWARGSCWWVKPSMKPVLAAIFEQQVGQARRGGAVDLVAQREQTTARAFQREV